MPARADVEFGLHFHRWLEAHVLCRVVETIILPNLSVSEDGQ